MSLDDISTCLTDDDRVHSLTIISDSNVRMFAKWIFNTLGFETRWNQEDRTFANKYRYLWNEKAFSLADKVDYELTPKKNQRMSQPRPGQPLGLNARDVVIMSTAHWDLMKGSISIFIQYTLPTLVYSINLLRFVGRIECKDMQH